MSNKLLLAYYSVTCAPVIPSHI